MKKDKRYVLWFGQSIWLCQWYNPSR